MAYRQLLLKVCPNKIHVLYGQIKLLLRFYFFRKGLITETFRGLCGYDIDWNNPQDLNEKINWMKLYYDTSQWTYLADKLKVREYVEEIIGEQYLPKIYKVWDNADQIDLTDIPTKFVLKTNHGCATVKVITDKNTIDLAKIKKQVKGWLSKKYGYLTVEPHYLNIHPFVYAEELLVNDSFFSSTLVDYKIYCFNGEPFCILICTNREIRNGKTHANYSYYDTSWNPLPDVLAPKLRDRHVNCPKPQCLDELLNCARKLSQGHPQVRVDFYIVNNKPIFGEMTFTSNGGYDTDITREFCLEMGNQIDLTLN